MSLVDRPSDQQYFLKMHLPRIKKRTQSPHRETVSPVLSYYSEPAYLQHRKVKYRKQQLVSHLHTDTILSSNTLE